jgi:hypothetical protein
MGVSGKPLRGLLRTWNHDLRGALGSWGLFGRLHPPILCVGAPNSGTTILGDAFGAHPDVENRSEARVLWDPRFHAEFGDTFRDADDATPRDVRRLRGNFAWYQRSTGAKVVLNKHPENTLRIHYLMRIFPEALLIHVVRDGRAAVCSNFTSASRKAARQKPFGGYLKPRGWRDQLDRPLLEQLAYMWNDAVVYASTEGPRYGERFLAVRYEDLPDGMPALAERVWRWAGLDVTAEHLAALPEIQCRNHKWRNAFTPEQVATVESVAREGLERFDYLASATLTGSPPAGG